MAATTQATTDVRLRIANAAPVQAESALFVVGGIGGPCSKCRRPTSRMYCFFAAMKAAMRAIARDIPIGARILELFFLTRFIFNAISGDMAARLVSSLADG